MGNNINPINGLVFAPPNPCTYSKHYPHEVVWILTKTRRKIPGYFLPSKFGATKLTLIYSHGNAGDIGAMFDFLKLLHENLPLNILHYEYIGYGLAKDQGPPSETNVYESVEAAVSYLETDHQIMPTDVILFGTSVGSAPTCYIGAEIGQFMGIILECPFTSIVRIVTQTIIARPIDMFPNIDRIDKANCPVLIFHGRKDTVVPFEHGKQLYEKVKPEFQFQFVDIEDADHHDIIERLNVYKYIKTIYDFILHCVEVRKTAEAASPSSSSQDSPLKPKLHSKKKKTSIFSSTREEVEDL